jgi:DNA invertase Pin-like site-specific DNA recombinase
MSGNPGAAMRKRTHCKTDEKTDRHSLGTHRLRARQYADQDLALQLDALTSAGCAKVFEDRASGVRTDRARLQAALDYMRDGDVLVTWKLDRLGRSLPHLIETVADLDKRGVGFRSITEAIDTTTPGGRLVFHLFGALGQFERDLIQERTRAGLAAAAARGRTGGRRPVVTEDRLRRARELVAKGLSVRDAAVRLKVGKTALYEARRDADGLIKRDTQQEHRTRA